MFSLTPRLGVGAAIVGVLLLSSQSSHASTMEAMSLAELAQEASLIVVGTVTARNSEYDEFGRIVTDHRIEVQQVWKGLAGKRPVVMRSLGGEIGDLAMTVPGAPHLAVGEQALFFLRPSTLKNPSGRWLKPLGMSQGVFRLRPPVATQPNGSVAPDAMPGAQGLRLLRIQPDGSITDGVPAISAPTSLEEVRRAVQQVLTTQEGKP